MKVKHKKYWTGEITVCDLCKVLIDRFFVDGNTKFGRWGILCLDCHKEHGVGIGAGLGQKYQKEFPSEKFFKIEG